MTPSPTLTPQPDDKQAMLQEEDLITADYPEMVRLLELLYESANIRDNTLNPTLQLPHMMPPETKAHKAKSLLSQP